jgi:nucleotide-binding universal stress UspA family protein
MGGSRLAHSILVPLDGSPLAELALHEALTLAQLPETKVVLLHVVPPIEDIITDGEVIAVDQQWENRRIHAVNYLQGICSRPEWKNVKTQVAVEMGIPAEVILDFARKHKIDWIVMSTHGRTGINRWVYGSVATKVLEAADRTVVLVRAGAPGASQATERKEQRKK